MLFLILINTFLLDDRGIRVDSSGVLYNGYIPYRIFKEHGVSSYNVDVMKKDQNEKEK